MGPALLFSRDSSGVHASGDGFDLGFKAARKPACGWQMPCCCGLLQCCLLSAPCQLADFTASKSKSVLQPIT